jgi:hypothetical protein
VPAKKGSMGIARDFDPSQSDSEYSGQPNKCFRLNKEMYLKGPRRTLFCFVRLPCFGHWQGRTLAVQSYPGNDTPLLLLL